MAVFRLSAPRSRPGRRFLFAFASLLSFLGLAAGNVASAQLAVYTDSLQNGFADWSWGTHDLAQTAVVHSGTAAISFEPDGWNGLFFHRDAGFTGTDYEAIELWVRGSGAGGQELSVAVLSGGSPAGSAAPSPSPGSASRTAAAGRRRAGGAAPPAPGPSARSRPGARPGCR